MNLTSILDGHPDDAVAVVSRGDETTYGTLREQIRRLGSGLIDHGVRAGDRVGVVAANNWYFIASYFAVLHAGAVAVPVNPRSPAAEVVRQTETVGAVVLMAGPGPARRLADAGSLDRYRLVVQPDASAIGVSFDELLAAPDRPAVERELDDLAVLMWTSGTAGGPKAAMLTNANLLANHQQLDAHGGISQGPGDVVLGVLPFSHIYGLNVVVGYSLSHGTRVVCVENFDPSNTVETIVRHGVTVFPAVPPMLQMLLDLPGLTADDLSSLRRLSSGASALPVEVFDAFQERFGLTITEGYGLTETAPAVTVSVPENARAGSVGRPLPDLEVRLVDDGEDALPGDPGEVWVRGPNVFAGYWNDPEATARVLDDDGWLHTGDIALAAEDGSLAIVDRVKDLIIVSGFNVYPAEVEEVLLEHPAVDQVAVVGVPHPHTGETVVAYVVATEGQATDEDELIDFVSDELPRYKAPSKVRFVAELPISDAGKLSRRLLLG